MKGHGDLIVMLRFWGGNGETESQACMLQAATVLSEIAESMTKPFLDPAEHANWCVERARSGASK